MELVLRILSKNILQWFGGAPNRNSQLGMRGPCIVWSTIYR